jgi:hypothetical protein
LVDPHGCQASVNAFFEGLLPEQKEHVRNSFSYGNAFAI